MNPTDAAFDSAALNLADLQIFKTVVDEGGIGRAARKMHRVPSNITTRVRQLETALAVQLFTRDRQRLHLSASGERLLAYADQLLRLSAEARNAVSGALPSGVLRLGALESTTASRLGPILSAYHRRYPDVRVELTTGTNDALTQAVAERRLEAAFVAQAPSDEALAHLPLFAERLLLIAPPERGQIRGPQDVAGASVIAFPNGCAYRRVLQRWLGERRVATLRVLELGSYHAIVTCVAAGAGIAVVPESVLDTMPSAQVTRHSLPKVIGHVTTPLIWRNSDTSAALLALQEQLRTLRRPARGRPG